MLFKQNEVPLRKSNKGKTWNHCFPTLPLFINLNFFLQLISSSNKIVIFMFMISKGSPTSLFFMFTPLSHHTNCCTQEKWTVPHLFLFHT